AEDQIVRKVCHTFICPAERGKCPITDLGLCVDDSERVLLTANGEKKSIIKSVTTTKLHGRDCLVETFIDNTARKQVDDELQAAYSQLAATEKELKEKFEELQKSKDIGGHYTAEQALRECEERLKNLMEKKSV
ncbi:MAG TPA: hypothetical protein VMV55_05060, partial [Methanoregula sp.]|nr:hypothetical protein [Methanoregula sp.]